MNGIDVTYPTRNFSQDEWNALRSYRTYVNQQREIINGRTGGRGFGRGNGGRDAGGRGTGAGRMVGSVQQQEGAHADDGEAQDAPVGDRGHQHGAGFGRCAYGGHGGGRGGSGY